MRGFTLIEVLIVIAIIGIIAAMVSGAVSYKKTECIGGVLFTTPDVNGMRQQIFSPTGGGIPCDEKAEVPSQSGR